MSESADYYMSWLGCNSFGVGSRVRLTAPEPITFQPTDLSACSFWFDATDNIAITADASNNIISWANDGDLSGVQLLPYFGTGVTGVDTINSLNVVRFPVGSNMYFYGQLTSEETTSFVVYKNLIDLSGLATPFLNLINGDATAGLQLGLTKDPSLGYLYVLCQSGSWCLVAPGSNDYERPLYVSGRITNTLADNYISVNGVNLTLTENHTASGMNTNPIPYSVSRTDGSSIDVGEIIIYNRALTDVEVELVYAYLASRWAIT